LRLLGLGSCNSNRPTTTAGEETLGPDNKPFGRRANRHSDMANRDRLLFILVGPTNRDPPSSGGVVVPRPVGSSGTPLRFGYKLHLSLDHCVRNDQLLGVRSTVRSASVASLDEVFDAGSSELKSHSALRTASSGVRRASLTSTNKSSSAPRVPDVRRPPYPTRAGESGLNRCGLYDPT